MEEPNVNVPQKKIFFFSDLKHEFKKIVWPTQRETFKNMGIVLSSIFIIGVFVFLLDKGFGELLRKLMSM